MTKVLKKWLKALRNGEYTQGKCMLYNEEDRSFCCLGVLVNETCCFDGKHFRNDPNPFVAKRTEVYYDDEVLPLGAQDLIGLDLPRPYQDFLINLNDSQIDYWQGVYYEAHGFNDIADIIEATYETRHENRH